MNKTWRDHPELALVPISRLLAGSDPKSAPAALDTAARSFGAASWGAMFEGYPLFRPDTASSDRSANHPALNSAIGLYHPQTAEKAAESWATALKVESTEGFELGEAGSRLEYRSWSLIARLLLFRAARSGILKSAELSAYAKDWLTMYWGLERMSTISTPVGPRSLRCGSRSQGAFGRMKSDYALSLASGANWHFVAGQDKYWKNSDEVKAFDSLKDELKASFSSLAGLEDGSDRFLRTMPNWPCLNETWYFRTSEGAAVWCDGEVEGGDDVVNANTPGIAAMGFVEGTNLVWALPPASDDHIRQKAVSEQVTTVRDGKVPVRLDYTVGGAGREMSLSRDLPKGRPEFLVVHGKTLVKEI